MATGIEICKKNKREYIIRFKAGSIPTVEEEFEKLKEKISKILEKM